MPKHKGDPTTNIFSKQGKANFDLINKPCGCKFWVKCECLVEKQDGK